MSTSVRVVVVKRKVKKHAMETIRMMLLDEVETYALYVYHKKLSWKVETQNIIKCCESGIVDIPT